MSDKIADNPSFKKFEDKIKGLESLSRFMPWLIDKEQKRKLKQINDEVEELRSLPDRYNSLYTERGWVCFGNMNHELIRRCVTLGENGNLEKGEQELIDYFHGDIRHLVLPLRNTPGFKERYDLLQKALDDFANNRYHACVPVFLMIIDGAVNQVMKKNQGLFAQNADLTLHDSIIGHKNGLSALIGLMSRARKKTTVAPVYIPYRNGIMHGMDVGYDNIYVATKALSTLFAVAEWIKQFCEGKQKASEQEKPKSLKEILADLKSQGEKAKHLKHEREMQNEWKPRDFSHTDFSVYKPIEGTPEYRIARFMELLKNANYGKMAEMTIDYSGKPMGTMAGKIRSRLKDIKCIDYTILDITDNSPAISEILLSVTLSNGNGTKQTEIKSRLIYQTDRTHSKPLVRGEQGGEWYIIESIVSEIFHQANAW